MKNIQNRSPHSHSTWSYLGLAVTLFTPFTAVLAEESKSTSTGTTTQKTASQKTTDATATDTNGAEPQDSKTAPNSERAGTRVSPKVRIRIQTGRIAPLAVKAAADLTREELPSADAGETKQEATPKSDSKPEVATHQHTTEIKIANSDAPCSLQTFCLSADGKVVAAVGCQPSPKAGPSDNSSTAASEGASTRGQLRWFEADGKAIDVWPIPIAPTALNFSKDGTLFVAGDGQLLKVDAKGKVLLTVDSPNKKEILDNKDALMAENREQFGPSRKRLEESLKSSKARLKELEDKQQAAKENGKELSRTDKVRLTAVRRSIETLEKAIPAIKDPTPEQIQQQIEVLASSKKRISGIAVTDTDVFVACYAALGWGYDIWRLDHQLQNPVKIVEKLRGCCGQMDIQREGNGICVAENSMHRVCRYDREGKLLKHFGERETVKGRGFEGCCNPMNLRLSKSGEIYTSESSIGRIRKFNSNGEYVGLVGQAKLVSGCKHVAVAVSPDEHRVYLLDVTKGEIVILERKSETAEKTVAVGIDR